MDMVSNFFGGYLMESGIKAENSDPFTRSAPEWSLFIAIQPG